MTTGIVFAPASALPAQNNPRVAPLPNRSLSDEPNVTPRSRPGGDRGPINVAEDVAHGEQQLPTEARTASEQVNYPSFRYLRQQTPNNAVIRACTSLHWPLAPYPRANQT